MFTSWLLASLVVNLAASVVVLAMGFLVLRKHPSEHYRWWVVASAWRVAAAAFGTLLYLSPEQPVVGLLSALAISFNGNSAYVAARCYLGQRLGRRAIFWPLGLVALGLPWVWATGHLPELLLLPPFVLLAGGYWAMALAMWRGGGSARGVGSRFTAVFAGTMALHALGMPFMVALDLAWAPVLTILSMFLDVALGMGLVIELLESSMAAERRAASTARDVGAKLSATASALQETRLGAQLAAQAARAQEALVRQIVHDLRNATQAMALINEELEEEAEGRPREMALVAALDRQLLFVSTFLRQKLAWLAERGAKEGQRTAILPILQSLEARLGPLLATRRQRLLLQLPAEAVPDLQLDGVALEQLLANLVLNAHQHGREGGTVELSLAISEGWATFAVKDDGPGIPPEVQARLGQRAHRSDGTGLGLSIVQQVVTEAGGRWGLMSEEGEGATFHVALPLVTWGAVRAEDQVQGDPAQADLSWAAPLAAWQAQGGGAT